MNLTAGKIEPGTIYKEIKRRNYVVVCGLVKRNEGEGVFLTAKNEMVKIVNPFTGVKRWVSIGHFNNLYERVYKIPENGWER